jgi:Fe-S oxidoreductase
MDNDLIGPPLREFMPGLPGWLPMALYAALVPTVIVFAWLFTRRIERSGTSVREAVGGLVAAIRAHPKVVARRVFVDVLGQQRVRRDRLGSVLHLLIFGSFLALLVGTSLIAIEHDFTEPLFDFSFLHGPFYLGYELVLDTAALALIAGTSLAMWRRYRLKPTHLGGRRSIHLVYGLLLYFALSGLVLEGLRLLTQPVPWSRWSYAGHSLSVLLDPILGGHAVGAYQAVWAFHVIVVFVVIAIVPLLMLDHILILPINIALQADRQPGTLRTPFDLPAIIAADGDLDGIKSGFGSPAELSWDRRFMLDACIDCGRCEAVCPAQAAGRDLSPRLLIQALGADLRTSVADGQPPQEDVFVRGVLEEATVWSCLSCGACARECPAIIDQPGTIVELRRHLVEEGKVDDRQAALLSGLERNNNPLGLPSYQRSDWLTEMGVPTVAEEPDAEYLYWIGCMASYDPRARGVAVAMIRILRHVGISFAVLGSEEKCLGESQRKLGDEAGFQIRAMENIETFRSHNIRKVLTHCPHCMSTLTKDYPQFGSDMEVVHHSALLAELIQQGRVPAPLAGDTGTLTYHDPCNLGRLSGIYDPPREVAKFAGGEQFVELEQSRDKSFCCGAGGANYFYKVPEEMSVSSLRLLQITAVGADTVATACPFCLGMLEDAASSSPGDKAPPKIADLAELVAAGLPELAHEAPIA